MIEQNNRPPIIKGIGAWFFALFLFAGYYKADPRLAFIQSRIDITLLFLGLSFLVFLYGVLRSGLMQKIPRDFAKIAILFLLLAACILGGLLYTESRQYGFDKALRFIFLTGWAFFGVPFLLSDFQSLRYFSWALVTISTAMAIDALVGYPGIGQVGFVTSFGSNYIALARAGGIGLLTTVGLLLPIEQRSLVRMLLWIVAALQLWAVLTAGARGPVLSLALAFLLFFMLSVRNFPYFRVDRFALRLGVVIFMVFVILALGGMQKLFPTLAFRVKLALTEGGSSVLTRLDLYRAAADLWNNSLIFGGGTGQFGVAVRGEDVRLYPHNIVLELGAENGFIGVFIFGALIVVAFAIGFTFLRSEKSLARAVVRYVLVACCFALLNAMISGDINDNRILFTFVGMIGVVTSIRS